jgi:streptogramin lyase
LHPPAAARKASIYHRETARNRPFTASVDHLRMAAGDKHTKRTFAARQGFERNQGGPMTRRSFSRMSLALVAAAAVTATTSSVSARPAGGSEIVATIRTPGFPGPVAVGFGSVWVGGHRSGTVYRIDPRTNRVAAKVEVPDTLCTFPALGAGSIWWPNCGEGGQYFYRIDPRSMRVAGRRSGYAPRFGAGSLWFTAGGPDRGEAIVRLDPRTGRPLARVTRLGFDKRDVFFVAGIGFGSAWVWSESGVVARINTKTNRLTSVIPAPGTKRSGAFAGGYLFGGSFAVAAGSVWLTNPAGLYRIDPKTNVATLVKLPLRPFTQYGEIALAAGDGALWIRTSDRTVARFDPRRRKVVAKYPAAGGGGEIAYAFDALWVANAYADNVWRIHTR